MKVEQIILESGALVAVAALFMIFLIVSKHRQYISGTGRRLSAVIVYVIFLVTALITRFPFFFTSVISWDESTYILAGQNLLDGNLPYVTLWENKPPLVFPVYAVFILLSGNTVPGIRLCGLICVVISACALYHTGKRWFGQTAGFFAALLLIIFTSTFEAGQSTLTEHVVLVPFSLILLLVSSNRFTPFTVFSIGFLLSAAALTRMNMIYLVPVTYIVMFFPFMRTKYTGTSSTMLSLLLAGTLLPWLTVSAIYLVYGHAGLLYRTVVSAPLAFIEYEHQNIVHKTVDALKCILSMGGAGRFIWLLFIPGILVIYLPRKTQDKTLKNHASIVLLFFMFVFISIIQTGRPYAHYYIQGIPVLALLGGITLSYMKRSWPGWIILLVLVVGLVSPLEPVFNMYADVTGRIYRGEPLRDDLGYRVARYVSSYNVRNRYVYFCSMHLGYWLTGSKIPTKYAHPSNVGKDFLIKAIDGPAASSEQTLMSILSKKPVCIIKTDWLWYFNNSCNKILNDEIRKKYELDAVSEGIYIYRRK